jgi:predicted phage terminase large subunit-like protein
MIDEQNHNKDWKVFVRKAEKEDGTYPFELIGLNRDFLKSQKERQGSYVFSCLYNNEPIDASTAFFYKDNFKFYRPPLSTDNLYKTCVVDPAGDGEDCTAIVVVGTNDRLKMYVLDAVNRHLQPNQIVSEIIRLSYIWGFTKLGIEINFFRNLERDIQNEIEANRQNHKFTPFSIDELTATAQRHSSKHSRILSLQPFHERGDLFFPNPEEHPKIETCDGAISELISQMMQYTQNHRPMHDDLIDALSYHIKLIQRGTGEAKEELPEDTIASIINRDVNEYNRMQRRKPLRFREYLQPVFMGE